MYKGESMNPQRGFTLIEVLVTSVIMVMLGGGILSLVFIITQTRLASYRNLLDVDHANLNVTLMVRELRNIRAGDNAAYPLERARDQEMIFYSDIDNDGSTEKVRYTLNGTDFTKGVIEPVGFPVTYPAANEKVKVLTDYVRNGLTPIFYYYNGDWPADIVNNPLAEPVRLSDTKLMRVYLELNSEDSGENFILESYVQLRMLKQNL